MPRVVRPGYAAIAVGFLALASIRAVQGAPVWAVVFVLAAAANGWLAVRAPEEAAESRPAPMPDGDRVRRSLDRQQTSARQWQLFGAIGAVLGCGLLFVEPPLAILAGLTGLFCLFRARRARRDVHTLRQLTHAD
ncbi:MAG: hypothetical protein GEU98_19215 [Pseudonocardiaceae bacterium]|nr:hypothetical protein [Pseudonocardiaceae bacterium]